MRWSLPFAWPPPAPRDLPFELGGTRRRHKLEAPAGYIVGQE